MKNIPEEIDLYDWYDYSFLRAVLKLPIPSPRVWDNAGAFGFTGGKYLKYSFFEPDFFEASLYTKEKLSSYIKEKYGNKLRLEKGKGKLMKSDKSNHKFVRTRDNNHLYLNFENFKKIKQLTNDLEYEKIYEAIGEINSLTRSIPAIDMGYCAPLDLYGYYKPQNKNEEKWINLNKTLEKEFNTNDEPIELLYENVYKFFDYPSKKLWDLNEILNNDFWFVEMFLYSFKPKTSRWLKGNSLKKDFEKPIISKYLDELKENVINQKNDFNEKTNTIYNSTNDEKVKNKISKRTDFSKNRINKKSPFPPWLPLVTIPLVLIISTSINNFRRQQTQPTIIVPPTTRNQEGLDLCQLCKITNSCDTIPGCEKGRQTCEWERTWDGKLVEKCRRF